MEANEMTSSVDEQPTDRPRHSGTAPSRSESPDDGVCPFIPALGLRNGHLQTLWGTVAARLPKFPGTVQRKVRVPNDDYVVLHDDEPTTWKRGQLIVLLLHGLSGCHGSAYMMRAAAKLIARNIRTFRLDHRGCGASAGLARHPYHAGRVEDLQAALETIERLSPDSPLALVGFSLSGNLILRYLGDSSWHHSHNLVRAVAVCPPIDLSFSVRDLWNSRSGERYDWYFTRRLIDQLSGSSLWRADVPLATVERLPTRLYDFDELYTAPASGFSSADDYYEFASTKKWIEHIRVPTTVLASQDDPLVSSKPLADIDWPRDVELHLTDHGGHLGFVGKKGIDADRRWMDWRVIDWLKKYLSPARHSLSE